ncbi:Spy0128 family protein, partial [Bilifractor sp. HCP3S3_D3]|uniref:Spy0128 family protein n=1 Tax=Bilifractor sp. HCP3S3_D3 TaxID=3438907 RepID=UPI003F8A717D
MKNKNTFRKWMALFLSISMVAASGITSNVRLRAAEDTPVQETTAEGMTSADTDASASENADGTTVANVDQNDTTRTEEIGLNGTEQAAEESAAPSAEENKNAETAAEAEQGTTPATVAESENKETAADSTASSSVSSSSEEEDKNLTASEQIDEARKDATKREYSYEDDLVSVTATLDDPKAVPDNAEFRVTPVTKDSTDYNYDAYMNALNDDAAASSDSDTEKQYTDENTLLYDMAFIYPVEEKDEDGNVTQKEVEVQPAEGAVKISVNFKKDQLTKSLDADKDSDVEIKHLPLTDAVKESNDTTADATNISADDVKVENVKNADVSIDSQNAEFKADSFSVFSFKTDQPSNAYCWNYGENEGTTFSYEDILNKINAKDNTTNYAIYANSLTSAQHLEGNIKVGALDITGNQKLNQDKDVVQRNAVTNVQVTKKLSQKSNKDQTFNFASYGSNNNQIEKFSITIKAGEISGVKVLENTSATVRKLESEDVTIYELDSKGNPVANNGKNDDYVVTYGNNVITSIKSESNSDSYIGSVKQSIGGTLSQNYFQGDINATTYIENFTNGHFDGNNYIFTSDGTVTLQDYYNIDADAIKIKQQSGIKSTVADNLDYLKGVSEELANAHMGATEGQGSLSVINIRARHETKWDTGTLDNDLNKVLTEVQNGKGILNTIREDGYLLINIDASEYPERYNLSQINIDNNNADNNNEELGRHIIYNVVQKDSEGNYHPYTGTVSVQNVTAGTLIAPSAHYYNDGGLRGEVIVDSCDRSSGTAAEIHKDSLTTQTTRKVEITNTSSAEGGIDLTGTKAMTGRTLTDNDQFTYAVYASNESYDKTGEVVANGSSKGSTITFDRISYNKAGEYYYLVKETSKDGNGITVDKNVKKVHVSVKDGSNGSLNAKVADDSEPISFTNAYSATGGIDLTGTKAMTGRTLTDNDQFTYAVYASNESYDKTGEVVANGSSKGSTITFDRISYNKAGEYYYLVKETSKDGNGITV